MVLVVVLQGPINSRDSSLDLNISSDVFDNSTNATAITTDTANETKLPRLKALEPVRIVSLSKTDYAVVQAISMSCMDPISYNH